MKDKDSSVKFIRVTGQDGPLNCTVKLPASKSISNRALIINALSYGPHKVRNLSDSDDTRVLESILHSNQALFDVGHAGTAMRFLTAFLSKIAGEWVLTGSERMQQRPIRVLVDALRKMGASIDYLGKEGFPPLKILGTHLKGGVIELDGSISSQYISALLMIAPTLDGGLTLRLKNKVASKSYIHLTLKLMEQAGIQHSWKFNEIRIAEQSYKPVGFSVEADWSAASYWYQMLALAPRGEILLEELRQSGLQGDEAVAAWFTGFGIETAQVEKGILLSKKEDMVPIRIFLNLHENPDLAQTMAALCVARKIPFHFTGLETLKIKETNRIAALQAELAKFGAIVTESAHGELKWNGKIQEELIEPLPVIETYDDHRMALSFAPLALANRQIIITHPEVVTKSYPGYWSDLRTAGFQWEEVSAG